MLTLDYFLLLKDLFIMPTVGIVFGGASTEYRESIRAARTLYQYALKELGSKYRFRYFLLTKSNKFASAEFSEGIIKKTISKNHMARDANYDRISSLARVNVIYSTLMGTSGENGNIMGLADILNVPIIGCGILASALALDKRLSKVLVKNASIPIVNYLFVDKHADAHTVIDKINKTVKFPCFVKPNNLGTCAYAFKAENASEFRQKWEDTISNNSYSNEYLIEEFIPNIEVRIFLHQDSHGKLHANDKYVTTLRDDAIGNGGVLFDHLKNRLPDSLRKQLVRYAIKIFKLFGMKDYARIDFFVEVDTNSIYFNEANTQPHIGPHAIQLMEQDGGSYANFIETMIHRNL